MSHLEHLESPTFAHLQLQDSITGLSPVTNLAVNLSEASLATTPRRRLSLSSGEDTPLQIKTKSLQCDSGDASVDSPIPGNSKLLKNAIKLPGVGGNQASNRVRSISRRINLGPDRCRTLHYNKENKVTSKAEETPTLALSPLHSPSSPPKVLGRQISSPLRPRQPLEDHDPNSQDSGYGTVVPEKEEGKTVFRFTEPTGLAPRRVSVEQSPRKESLLGTPQSRAHGHAALFRSLSASSGYDSIDDGFMELECEKPDDETRFPTGLTSLLSGTLRDQSGTTSSTKLPVSVGPRFWPPLRSSLSLIETSTKPQSSLLKPVGVEETRSDLLDPVRPFKRPDPPCENLTPLQVKRLKFHPLQPLNDNSHSTAEHKSAPELQRPPRLLRSFSETEATIKRALQRSTQEPDLIGDFSKPFVLPLIAGRHQDLKTISSETLVRVMNGEFSELVDSYLIIDCRYPYEFNGGHIKGARNIYTKDQIIKEFVENQHADVKSSPGSKRKILIFHCEFSSERGPSLSRFLRNSDRLQNKESYPALNYPEVYLLHGGYKDFFERFSEMCEPCCYLPMLDPQHEAEMRHFRSKSKSWAGDSKSRLALRSNLKRLGL